MTTLSTSRSCALTPLAVAARLRASGTARRLALCALVVLAVAAIVPATATATATASATAGGGVTPGGWAQATANVTDATTGIADASSTVVPRDACSAPTPGQATCLAQFLALRGTRTPIHAHVRQAASPNRFIRRHARSRGAASALAVPAASSPQPGTPAYLQQAYDLAYLSQTAGTGQTVAVIDVYDDPSAEADLAAYRSHFSLPACTSDNGCFEKVDQTGGTAYPSQPPSNALGWGLETSLDLDAVSALCPSCHIVFVEATSLSLANMVAAHKTANKLGATVISDSWRMLPTNSTQQSNFEHGAFTFAGTPTVAASGDSGYLGVGSDPACSGAPFTQTPALCNAYPAAQPGVTAVGGTTLAPASGPRGMGESAWVWKDPATKDTTNDGATGSGCDTSPAATKPTWQTDTGCAGRAYNDISANGNPATGMLVYGPSYQLPDGTSPADIWTVVGGTSEAAPLVAAYYALLQSNAGGSTSLDLESPEWLYDTSDADLLNHPIGGSNGSCDVSISYICHPTPDDPGPTGMGSISGAVVTGAPGIAGPGTSGSYTQSINPTGAELQGGVYPNGDDTSYWWEYGTTTAYGQETSHVLIGSGTQAIPAVPVTTTLSGLQPNTTYHYRLVAENGVGPIAGYDFTFTTAAAPPPPVTTTAPAMTTPPPRSTPLPTMTTPPPRSTPPPTTIPHTLPSPPSLGRLRILALGSATMTASATIDAHGASTTYYLAYGTTRALGRRMASRSSTQTGTAAWNLSGLAAGRVYYLQVVATNAGATRRTAAVRVKTSPVKIGKLAVGAGELAVVLRCHGSGACPVRLAAKAGKLTIATGTARIPGNHSATVLLKLNRAAVTRASHAHKLGATLSAISVWNGYAAAVSAKFRLALRS